MSNKHKCRYLISITFSSYFVCTVYTSVADQMNRDIIYQIDMCRVDIYLIDFTEFVSIVFLEL